jgi:hypothetical protein
MTTDAEPVLRLTRPEEWLQAIPYLFGFTPADSLVLLGLVGPRKRVHFQLRVDLPTPDDVEPFAEHVAELTGRQDLDAVVVVLYGAQPGPPTPLDRDLWDLLGDQLAEEGDLEVVDAIVVRGDRWWSLECADPRCCPPEGTAVETSGRVAAEMVLRGCVARGSREELAAEISPVGGPAARLLSQRCEAYAAGMFDVEPMGWSPKWVDAAVDRWRLLLTASTVEVSLPDPDSLAALLVPLEHLTLRDRVAGVCLLNDDRARRVLRSVVRRAPRERVAAPATILGLLEWAGGDGIRAMLAFERALGADPGYAFATLLVQGLQHGLRLPEDFLESIRDMGRHKPAGRSRRARPAR